VKLNGFFALVTVWSCVFLLLMLC